jgi:hypothetical protein
VATVQDSILTLTAEAYVEGVNAQASALPALSLLAPTPGGLGFLFQSGGPPLFNPQASICADYTGVPGNVVPINPPILTNRNFGTLQYGDPFDSTWTRALAFCQQATIPIPVPGFSTTYSFLLVDGESAAPASQPLAPLALPVRNPAINGSNFFTAATITSTMPTLSWTAPTGISPYGYKVRPYVLTTNSAGAPVYQPFGSYGTSGTSLTVPPLSGGNTYIFTITTEVDGVANMQTAPFRSELPTGFASVVSAPITISPTAAAPHIDGDIKKWNRLVNSPSGNEAPASAQPPVQSPCAVSVRTEGCHILSFDPHPN